MEKGTSSRASSIRRESAVAWLSASAGQYSGKCCKLWAVTSLQMGKSGRILCSSSRPWQTALKLLKQGCWSALSESSRSCRHLKVYRRAVTVIWEKFLYSFKPLV